MRVFCSAHVDLQLPPGHRFPGAKYAMLRSRLLSEKVFDANEVYASPEASRDELCSAHDADYVDSILSGSVAASAMRRIGFPWSEHVARRSRATVGGALAAARAALVDGVSGQLAGGTHHAHRDFGSGYCVFNDFAVVALSLILERRAARIAIIDLDVHQGDGNASILGGRDDVFILSMHAEKNFPFRKAASTLDVALPDNIGDRDYLGALAEHLPAVWAFGPDLVLYQAGVDPLKEDRLGRLALTHRGLMERDRMVIGDARARGVPVSIAIGGGYADPIEASVEAYANTWRVARACA
jgi:acetoin utilization deacetylase AcuC-like enzyme